MRTFIQFCRFDQGTAHDRAFKIVGSFLVLSAIAIIGLAIDPVSATQTLTKSRKVTQALMSETFEFKLPNGWTQLDVSEAEATWEHKKNGFVFLVRVEEVDPEVYARLVSAPKSYLNSIRKDLVEAEEIGIKKIDSAKLDGLKAGKLVGTFPTPEDKTLYGSAYFFAGGEPYQVMVLTLAANAKSFAKADPVFKSILGSFKHTPAPVTDADTGLIDLKLREPQAPSLAPDLDDLDTVNLNLKH